MKIEIRQTNVQYRLTLQYICSLRQAKLDFRLANFNFHLAILDFKRCRTQPVNFSNNSFSSNSNIFSNVSKRYLFHTKFYIRKLNKVIPWDNRKRDFNFYFSNFLLLRHWEKILEFDKKELLEKLTGCVLVGSPSRVSPFTWSMRLNESSFLNGWKASVICSLSMSVWAPL